MSKELIWKRMKDGSLISRTPKNTFVIQFKPERTMGLFDECSLLVNGKLVAYPELWNQRVTIPSGKQGLFESEKDWKERLVKREETIKINKEKYKKLANLIHLKKKLPKVPDDSHIREGIKKDFKSFMKQRNRFAKYLESVKQNQNALAAKATSKEDKPMKYTGPSPDKREYTGFQYLITVTNRTPVPFKPENYKFASLYKWAEKIRDYYELRKQYISVEWLCYCVQNNLGIKNIDLANKVAKKIRLIYARDVKEEKERFKMLVDLRPPEVREAQVLLKKPEKIKKVKKEKTPLDKWGSRVGTKASAINDAISTDPKSIKRIAFESDASVVQVTLHLKKLIQKKFVKEVDGKYRIRKTKKNKGLKAVKK